MDFDYEATTWGGGGIVTPNAPDFLDHSLHLRYALGALEGVSGSVLEVGCGSGRFIASIAAARPDLRCHGCDVSRTAIAEGSRHGAVTLCLAGAEALPFEDHTLDAVLMIDVLEHLPNLERGLDEVRRVLKPKAPFHLVFPCERHPGTLHGHLPFLRNLKRRHAGHVQQLSPKSLFELLERHGFQRTQTKYSYHLMGQLYDLAVFGLLGLGVDMHGTRRARVETEASSPIKRVRSAVSRLLYWESSVLANVPLGMTVHVTSV